MVGTLVIRVFIKGSSSPVFERIIESSSLFPFETVIVALNALFGDNVIIKFSLEF